MVTIFIIAFILGAIVSVNITSIDTRNAAEKVTRAEAAAQKVYRRLVSNKPYADALLHCREPSSPMRAFIWILN